MLVKFVASGLGGTNLYTKPFTGLFYFKLSLIYPTITPILAESGSPYIA